MEAIMKQQSAHFARWALAFAMAMAFPEMAHAGDASLDQSRYFSFVSYAGSPKIDANEFIVEITDAAVAKRFSEMVRNQALQPQVAFSGQVVAGRAPYNEGWAFHVDPSSIRVGDGSHIEVCAATPEYVEEHLAEVGGSFLPGHFWCSWDLHIAREVLR